jgi:hypothetical protein
MDVPRAMLFPCCIAFALMASCACFATPDGKELSMKSNTILCEVNRYNLIAILEVGTCQPGAWAQDPENELNEWRKVALSGKVLKVIQGDPSSSNPESFKITVVQRRPASGRIAENYGPWSQISAERGSKLLSFSHQTTQSSFERALEKDTELVISLPDPTYPFAVEDTRLVVALKERQGFPGILAEEDVQGQLFQDRKSAGPIMARFLVDACGLVEGQELMPLIFRLVEAEDAVPLMRAELLRHLVDAFSSDQGAPLDQRARLIRAMIAILREPTPGTTMLKESIRQSYLRSVIFTSSGSPRLPVEDVISSAAERERLREFLSGQKVGEEVNRYLNDWLGR